MGSISGLTLIDILAIFLAFSAIRLITSSSSKDSTLKNKIPNSIAFCISSGDLATPEKTTLFGSAPIAVILSSSPPDTISKPEPRSLKIFRIDRLELAFTE